MPRQRVGEDEEGTGSLKMNFDKKVRFGEQLGFKTSNGEAPHLFESELAQPIEFKNNFKAPQSAGMSKLSGGKVKKGQVKKLLHGQLNTLMMNNKKKVKPTAAVV